MALEIQRNNSSKVESSHLEGVQETLPASLRGVGKDQIEKASTFASYEVEQARVAPSLVEPESQGTIEAFDELAHAIVQSKVVVESKVMGEGDTQTAHQKVKKNLDRGIPQKSEREKLEALKEAQKESGKRAFLQSGTQVDPGAEKSEEKSQEVPDDALGALTKAYCKVYQTLAENAQSEAESLLLYQKSDETMASCSLQLSKIEMAKQSSILDIQRTYDAKKADDDALANNLDKYQLWIGIVTLVVTALTLVPTGGASAALAASAVAEEGAAEAGVAVGEELAGEAGADVAEDAANAADDAPEADNGAGLGLEEDGVEEEAAPLDPLERESQSMLQKEAAEDAEIVEGGNAETKKYLQKAGKFFVNTTLSLVFAAPDYLEGKAKIAQSEYKYRIRDLEYALAPIEGDMSKLKFVLKWWQNITQRQGEIDVSYSEGIMEVFSVAGKTFQAYRAITADCARAV